MLAAERRPRSETSGPRRAALLHAHGSKPFKGEKLADTLRNVLQSELAPLARSARPARTDREGRRALDAQAPDERFPSVHEFAQQLLPFAGDATAFSRDGVLHGVGVEKLGEPPTGGVRARRSASGCSRSPPRRGTASHRSADHLVVSAVAPSGA